jgi:hypothetical protein
MCSTPPPVTPGRMSPHPSGHGLEVGADKGDQRVPRAPVGVGPRRRRPARPADVGPLGAAMLKPAGDRRTSRSPWGLDIPWKARAPVAKGRGGRRQPRQPVPPRLEIPSSPPAGRSRRRPPPRAAWALANSSRAISAASTVQRSPWAGCMNISPAFSTRARPRRRSATTAGRSSASAGSSTSSAVQYFHPAAPIVPPSGTKRRTHRPAASLPRLRHEAQRRHQMHLDPARLHQGEMPA